MSIEISVIIPFYKTPIYKLRRCIESFLKQSFADYELLLIDDGNPSKYKFIREEYEKLDKRIRFICQKNAGVSASRNAGLDRAQGQYIVFCDSDDFVENNYLYSLYEAIRGNDLVICGVAEQWFPAINSKVDMRIFCSTPSQYNWLQYVNFSVNKIFKRSIIEEQKIRFNTCVKLGEDALFIAEYLNCCNRIQCISSNLYHYVPNDHSATHSYHPKYWKWEEQVIASQYGLFTKYPLSTYEAMFMRRWLYVKIKGALYYYLYNEKNVQLQKLKLREILNSPYYSLMFEEMEENILLNYVDKSILKSWRKAGIQGIQLSNWITRNKQLGVGGFIWKQARFLCRLLK